MTRRRVMVAGVVLVGVFLMAPAAYGKYRGSDFLSQLAPDGGWGPGGLMSRYPIGFFQLDTHIDTGTLGTNFSAYPAIIADFFAGVMWEAAVWWMTLGIELFGWAFTTDFVFGTASRPGAIVPVGRAVGAFYRDVVGVGGMYFATGIAALWALWQWSKSETSKLVAGAVLSLVMVVAALAVTTRPQEVLGFLGTASDQISRTILGYSNGTDTGSAQQKVTDRLFRTGVLEPFAVLDFGGLTHCFDPGQLDNDGFPAPVPVWQRGAVCRPVVQEDRSGHGGYLSHYLDFAPGTDQRDAVYSALDHGQLPIDAPRQLAGWQIDKGDASSVDIQQQGGAFQRLLMAVIVFVGAFGLLLLLGWLSLAIIGAGLFMLMYLGFAPAAVIAALIPGKGHALFESWATRLAIAAVIKVAYALLLSVVLMVAGALIVTSASLGWLASFSLVSAYYWSVFLFRNRLIGMLGVQGARGGHAQLAMLAYLMRHPGRSQTRINTREDLDKEIELEQLRRDRERMQADRAHDFPLEDARFAAAPDPDQAVDDAERIRQGGRPSWYSETAAEREPTEDLRDFEPPAPPPREADPTRVPGHGAPVGSYAAGAGARSGSDGTPAPSGAARPDEGARQADPDGTPRGRPGWWTPPDEPGPGLPRDREQPSSRKVGRPAWTRRQEPDAPPSPPVDDQQRRDVERALGRPDGEDRRDRT
jgi:hypothetical protein